MIEQHSGIDLLRDLATPDIYRENLFRVLGLQVNATSKEAQQQQNRRKMQQSLGITAVRANSACFELAPPPTEDKARAALERMNRPVDRLIDEIFWFWPTGGSVADDEALEALAEGQVEMAAKLWTERTKRNEHGQTATHNLAVLNHLLALDHEASLSLEGSSQAQIDLLNDLWLRAFAGWKEVLDGEDFWDMVKDRARCLDDPQLTTGLVRRIREALPTALLLINARIALATVERQDGKAASSITKSEREHILRQVQLIRSAIFVDVPPVDIIRTALEPTHRRIIAAIDTAKNRWTATPHHGNRYARELHEQTSNPLAIVDLMLPPDDIFRIELGDTIAEAIMDGQVIFANSTNDWGESLRILDLAKEMAISEPIQAWLARLEEVVRTRVKSGDDWYATDYWELPQESIEQLESARAKTKSGDLDGAIQVLIAIDRNIGYPLLRCLAFCLILKGIRVFNKAIEEYDAQTATQIRLWNSFQKILQRQIALVRPDPHSSSVPPCVCCGNRVYTQWANITFKGFELFWCDQCAGQHRSEIERRARAFQQELRTALEHVLLAHEVDPGNMGVKKNLNILKARAKDFDCSIPTTTILKNELSSTNIRGKLLAFESSSTDNQCYFCHNRPGGDSCRISVPMYGDLTVVDAIFGKRVEFQYADVVVPRCESCRKDHRRTTDAHAEVLVAEAIGSKCERCDSARHWQDNLCRRCDKGVFQLGGWAKGLVMAAFSLGILGTLALLGTLGILGSLMAFVMVGLTVTLVVEATMIGVSLLFALIIVGGFDNRLQKSRRKLRNQRAEEIKSRRRAAVEYAHENLDRVAENSLVICVAQENTYVGYARIQDLLGRKWSFGHVPDVDGERAGKIPVDVTGLTVRTS